MTKLATEEKQHAASLRVSRQPMAVSVLVEVCLCLHLPAPGPCGGERLGSLCGGESCPLVCTGFSCCAFLNQWVATPLGSPRTVGKRR